MYADKARKMAKSNLETIIGTPQITEEQFNQILSTMSKYIMITIEIMTIPEAEKAKWIT